MLKVLKELGVDHRPRLHVLNKTDRLAPLELEALQNSNGGGNQAVFTSAITGQGLDNLLQRIDAAMPVDPLLRLTLRMPISDGRNLSLIQAGGRVLHSELDDGHLLLEAELPQSLARKLDKFALGSGRKLGAEPAEFEM